LGPSRATPPSDTSRTAITQSSHSNEVSFSLLHTYGSRTSNSLESSLPTPNIQSISRETGLVSTPMTSESQAPLVASYSSFVAHTSFPETDSWAPLSSTISMGGISMMNSMAPTNTPLDQSMTSATGLASSKQFSSETTATHKHANEQRPEHFGIIDFSRHSFYKIYEFHLSGFYYTNENLGISRI